MASAFAMVQQEDAQLFTALARTAEQRLDEFNAQNLANMAWAFRTADLSDELLFVTLARAQEWLLGKFSAQNLANTSWVFSKFGGADTMSSLLLTIVLKSAQTVS